MKTFDEFADGCPWRHICLACSICRAVETQTIYGPWHPDCVEAGCAPYRAYRMAVEEFKAMRVVATKCIEQPESRYDWH